MEQTNTNTTEAQPTYKVSGTTANYVRCLQYTQELYTAIAAAVAEQYEHPDGIMEQDYYPLFSQLQGVLYKYIGTSVNENLNNTSNNNKTIEI